MLTLSGTMAARRAPRFFWYEYIEEHFNCTISIPYGFRGYNKHFVQ